jgi:uncharacterized DUF497 family protein
MFSFEYDQEKSRINLGKHGIDFVQAQALWSDPSFIEIPARTFDEPRALVIGRIGAGTGRRSLLTAAKISESSRFVGLDPKR